MGLVSVAFDVARGHLHPLSNPTEAERIAVLAVGGFGRAEMAPHSDVDLLFLTPWKVTPWAESVVESMLYMLWDLKLKVGHCQPHGEGLPASGGAMTSPSAPPCWSIASSQATNRSRSELGDRLWGDLFRGTGPEFIDAKLAERAERHRRQGGQRYVLEPNVKEGKGGLRDLQTLYWIGQIPQPRGQCRRGWSAWAC